MGGRTGGPEPARVGRPAQAHEMLSFEKLDVYRVALEFRAVVNGLVPRRGQAELRDQIERASTSIVLNIAEGAGRWGSGEKAQFYAVARGSATECVGVLDLFRA